MDNSEIIAVPVEHIKIADEQPQRWAILIQREPEGVLWEMRLSKAGTIVKYQEEHLPLAAEMLVECMIGLPPELPRQLIKSAADHLIKLLQNVPDTL